MFEELQEKWQFMTQYLQPELLIQQLTYDAAHPLIFSSGLFLFMFLAFTFVYMLLRHHTTARLLFVTLFSYYFYYKSSGFYFFLLAVVTISDWLIGAQVGRLRNEGRKLAAQWMVALSMVIDLALLCYFKYTNFFFGSISQIIGNNFQPWDIFLPVGVSFFTFQSMSYTIDIYRGHVKPLRRLLDYAFFVSFFPQLVAGPIVKAREFVPQIHRPLTITSRMMGEGVFLILIGLFKKAVISDYISLNYVDRIFDNPALYTGIETLLGVYGYTVQIYCDFSGYSDMAIGIALLLGFRFPQNFNAPYTSASITEFWRRWHISLSSWLRDYLYISLGGNRKGKFRTYLNNFLTFLICGLWHGAAFNFIIWGAWHGLGVVAHKLFSQEVLHHDRRYRSHGVKRFFAVIITFHFCVLGWIMFRATDISQWSIILHNIFLELHPEYFWPVIDSFRLVFALIAFALISHWLPYTWQRRMTAILSRSGVVVHALLLTAVIYIIIQVRSSDIQPFIYFQF